MRTPVYIGTRVRDCLSWTGKQDGQDYLGIDDAASGSWARAFDTDDDSRWRVIQHGPRRLWDEVESAVYSFFDDAGQPTAADWIVHIDSAGFRLQLERPVLPVGGGRVEVFGVGVDKPVRPPGVDSGGVEFGLTASAGIRASTHRTVRAFA